VSVTYNIVDHDSTVIAEFSCSHGYSLTGPKTLSCSNLPELTGHNHHRPSAQPVCILDNNVDNSIEVKKTKKTSADDFLKEEATRQPFKIVENGSAPIIQYYSLTVLLIFILKTM
jgi:hypothetical protein